jgi:hypothetical protein
VTCESRRHPAPDLKDARSTQYRVRIARERIELVDGLVQLLFGGEAIREHRVGDVLQSDTEKKFDPALERSGVNEVESNIFEACLPEQLWKAGADVRIGAAPFDGFRVELDGTSAGQSGSAKTPRLSMSSTIITPPGWMCRRKVETTRGGIPEVRQEKPGIDDVELFVRLPLADVADLEPDIRQCLLSAFESCQVDLGLVEIHAKRSTCLSCCASELERDIAAATSHIEADRAGRDTNTGEQAPRRGGP